MNEVMIEKVDLGRPSVDSLNRLLDEGWSIMREMTTATSSKILVFLEKGPSRPSLTAKDVVGLPRDTLPVYTTATPNCAGTKKNGDQCGGFPIDNSLYCVAHQDQGE